MSEINIYEYVEALEEAILGDRVKVTNLKTGEVTIMPPELVEKAMDEVKEKWISGLLYGYEI